MQNVILTVHLILALLLIGVVLLQRSEGGGLGMGGGAGVMTARGAANALTKLTWTFAIMFFATSIALTFIAAEKSGSSSIVDKTGTAGQSAPAADTSKPALPAPTGDLLPPTTSDAPATPPASN